MDLPDSKFNTPLGKPVPRREDAALLTGHGCYTDDIRLPDALHIAFVRADAVGPILSLDRPEDPADIGADHVFTADDLGETGLLTVNAILPDARPTHFPILAKERALAVGQPVAAVLAPSRSAAQDASEAVYAEIGDPQGADLFPEFPSNRAMGASWKSGSFDTTAAQAAHVVECVVQHPRLAPSALEPRAVAARYDEDRDGVTVWLSTQTPHRARTELSRILKVPETRIRVVAPDVGGAFGMKASLYPEDVFVIWAALTLRRSVRWTASRSEDFLSGTHGRGARTAGRLAIDADGRFLALEARIDCPLGHWLPTSAAVPAWNAGRMLPGPYDIPVLDIETRAVLSTTAPVGIYRGAGRPEATALMERLVSAAASKAGIDPLKIRQRNLLTPDALPHEGVTGRRLDSGDYPAALRRLSEAAGYADLCETLAQRRAAGEIIGLGVAFYVEPCGQGWESARVRREADGRIVAEVGASSQGHGRETAFAQILADRMAAPMDAIEIRFGDTAVAPKGIGALASRSTPIGGSALALAADQVIARLREIGDGETIEAEVKYEAEGEAWGYGAYLAVLSIDSDTGVPTLEQLVCVDDAGTIVNPMMVEGQIRGGIAQGIGEALLETLVYAPDGQLLTGSFSDYALPRADDIPPVTIVKTETPSPVNLLGAKGVGEAGTIGAPAAILNAAYDALKDCGVTYLSMPLTSEKLWRALNGLQEQQDD
ncbi:MAG: xanthine dehydrogenase family protein [Alphaproteobacteria bacterium]|nr:xanthine dehydrogenase family protein [Alphaproteobacteria bacterium]MBO6864061.1 xanthine dehydrogenase family protein [Alphaproteobacteria bacterium]